jgi:sugar phosphate isomerase/epimerase
LVKIANAEGVILTIETHMGTLAETPEGATDLCRRVPGLALTLDPSHYLVGAARGRSFDAVYPFVKHVRLRDTGAGPMEFQVRVGQGQVDYGRIISQLERHSYDRLLTVDVRDIPDAAFAVEPEVRKLKYLLESLV